MDNTLNNTHNTRTITDTISFKHDPELTLLIPEHDEPSPELSIVIPALDEELVP